MLFAPVFCYVFCLHFEQFPKNSITKRPPPPPIPLAKPISLLHYEMETYNPYKMHY
jgi:hypothetical protein